MPGHGLTETEKRAFQLFLAAYAQATRQIGRDLGQSSEITLEQYDVLVTLEYCEDYRIRLSDLAERILLSRSGLTRLIDKLESRGLVVRESCEEDKRGAFAVLTPLGLQARQNAWTTVEASMEAHFARYFSSPEDLQSFSQTCRKIAFQGRLSQHPWDKEDK